MAIKIFFACVTVFFFIGLVNFVKVSAQSANTEQLTQIRANCLSIKNTLGQIHSSDALLRVNMGQRYELVSTKLMDRFNSRVISNSLKIGGLAVASDDYKSKLDTFRLDYINYEESLAAAIRIDCHSDPSGFYDILTKARYNRGLVYADIKNLNQQIDQYRLQFSDFEKNINQQRVGNDGK